jgi:hypothetical protein
MSESTHKGMDKLECMGIIGKGGEEEREMAAGLVDRGINEREHTKEWTSWSALGL